jgi:hypothetical protein
MARAGISVTVLAEDLQHVVFVQRFLRQRGKRRYDIRALPSSGGSAEQWVRLQFPSQLRALRSRQRNACLIVVTDADNLTVDERVRTLVQSCVDSGVSPHTPQEPVLLVVPKRNIETWIAYLRGVVIDEQQVYAKCKYESECHPQAEELARRCAGAQAAPQMPSSLQRVCGGFRRIPI